MSKEEGNKLIANWLGWEYDPDTTVFENGSWHKGDGDLAVDLLFDESWDALMPVVEKIQKLNHLVSINFYSEKEAGFPIECKIYNWGIGEPEQESEDASPIKAVWQAVIEFIKHNTQTPKV